MNRQYRILVLTDHTGHSDQNSIYAILSQMLSHQQCLSIDIASRGLPENALYFTGMQRNALLVSPVTSDFRYTPAGDYYKHCLKKADARAYDLVLLRLPRPISDEFLLWLEEVYAHATIVNAPSGIIATSTKQYLLEYPDLCPDIRLCHCVADIEAEVSKYAVVLKPLREYGGRGLLKINGDRLDDGTSVHNTTDYLRELEPAITKEGYLSMRYLKNVAQGDKRLLVVDGEVMAASLRLPAEGSWLCNVAQGGKSVSAEVTPEEYNIVARLAPDLRRKGILISGVDTLVNDDGKRVLSEVNTLSIGGFPQAEAQTGRPIIKQTIDKIFEYADVNG